MKIKTRLACTIVCTFGLTFTAVVRAESGDDNPTGPAGIFHGVITTGGLYSPYTRNVIRQVTDISIAGAVGTQPLAFTRVGNSRWDGGYKPFAYAGSWNHSYALAMSDETPDFSDPNALPIAYTLNYPDGRSIRFTSAAETPAGNAGDTAFRGPVGLSERLTPLSTANGTATLTSSDGTKVIFQATVHFDPDEEKYYRTYQALQMIDRFGLVTTLTYNTDDGRLYRITEPGGRWLQLSYVDFVNGSVMDHVLSTVQGSDGRIVRYGYESLSFSPDAPTYTCLTTVSYYDDATVPPASYTYRAPNKPDLLGNYTGSPLLWSCDDPMYDGPMKRIAYDYLEYSADSSAVYGELLAEKHSIGGVAVSEIYSDVAEDGIVRLEKRGDGPVRSFTYSTNSYVGHRLLHYSDFLAHDAQLGYDAGNYLGDFYDANTHHTQMIREPITGRITSMIHPPDVNNVQSSISYFYTSPLNPYYFDHITDEREHTKTYHRYPNATISEIDYPDGGSGTWVYNDLNQVLTHTMTNGGTESFEYYPGNSFSRNLKKSWTDGEGHKTFYDYDSLGRLSTVTDPRGAALGDIPYTTNFEYNSRGQLTKTIHPVDPVTGLRYFVQNTYNAYGSLESVTDELGHVTSYTYDDYQRRITMTTPLRAPGDDTPRTTYYYYDRNFYGPDFPIVDYTHTDSNVTYMVLPSGKAQKTIYDEDLRKKSLRVAPGTVDEATTYYDYDLVGNMLHQIDPRANSTEYHYDDRDRLIWMNDPIPADRNSLGHTVDYTYDQADNKLSEQRANDQIITYDSYDEMNRLTQKTVPQDPNPAAVTQWSWFPSGMLDTMTDPRGKLYSYGYDFMNRKTSLTYPKDDGGVIRAEGWHYDPADNRDTFTNRAGYTQTFVFDNRNRETYFSWNDSSTRDRTTSYDAASRVVNRHCGTDSLDYIYDDANNMLSETQNGRTVGYTYDADTNRQTITYPSGAVYTYDYTQRNQMKSISAGATSLVNYVHDPSGNLTLRTLGNGTDTTYGPADPVNRIPWVQHHFAGALSALYDYGFDKVGRRKYELRDSDLGDAWSYDLSDQLATATPDAHNVDTTPSDGTKAIYNLDESGNRKKLRYQTSGGLLLAGELYQTNDLNEYTASGSFGTTALGYDANGNLASKSNPNGRETDTWTYVYDAQNRLTQADNDELNEHLNIYYDALGRQILRYVNGAWIYSVWDGWDLIEEWDENSSLLHTYVHGARVDEMVKRTGGYATLWYYQDGRGNTSHVADNVGNPVEKYRYDVFGAPKFFNAAGTPLTASVFDVHFLFAGRDYSKEMKLYDNRNRYYHPGLGRFLQPDPIGFSGDASNLYRYCGNSPVNASDPMGTLVEIGWREVFVGPFDTAFAHAFIILRPDNPSAFAGDPLFQNNTLTISAHDVGGNLNSQFNYDINFANTTNTITLNPADDVSGDTQLILDLISTASAYPNDTIPYSTMGIGLDGYNSNGFINYVVTKNGYNGNKLLKKLAANLILGSRPPPVDKYTKEPFDNVNLNLQLNGFGHGTDASFGFGGFSGGLPSSPFGPGGLGYGFAVTAAGSTDYYPAVESEN